jgi:hypothetical protein
MMFSSERLSREELLYFMAMGTSRDDMLAKHWWLERNKNGNGLGQLTGASIRCGPTFGYMLCQENCTSREGPEEL